MRIAPKVMQDPILLPKPPRLRFAVERSFIDKQDKQIQSHIISLETFEF